MPTVIKTFDKTTVTGVLSLNPLDFDCEMVDDLV